MIRAEELLAMQKAEANVEARAGPVVKFPAGTPFDSMYLHVVVARVVGFPKQPAVRCTGRPGQNTPVPDVSVVEPVVRGERSTPNGARVAEVSGQSCVVRRELVVMQAPPELDPESQVPPVHVGQGWVPGSVCRSPVTRTVTVRGSVWVAAPVMALRLPDTAGLAAIVLMTHVLAPGEPAFGIGSGGPNVQPGDVQVRLLPVSVEVVAART